MSVLIKGMEMPTSCDDCRFAVDGWCYACQPESKAERKRITTNYCPLVPVPPHGDLIDRDVLMGKKTWVVDAWSPSMNSSMSFRTEAVNVCAIMNAPTIIPADPAEEGE